VVVGDVLCETLSDTPAPEEKELRLARDRLIAGAAACTKMDLCRATPPYVYKSMEPVGLGDEEACGSEAVSTAPYL
jgi:hypothetical protein